MKEGQVTPFCLDSCDLIQEFIETLPVCSEKKIKRRRSLLKGGSLSAVSTRKIKSTSLSTIFDAVANDSKKESATSCGSVVQIRERTHSVSINSNGEPLKNEPKKHRKSFFLPKSPSDKNVKPEKSVEIIATSPREDKSSKSPRGDKNTKRKKRSKK